MSRTILPFRDAADWRLAAPAAAAHLRAGGLLAHPTETIYGIGCALRPEALQRLAHLKGRPGPFLVLAAPEDWLAGVVWSSDARRLARAFWPGPLTLILATAPGAFPAAVLGPGDTLAVRATSHPGMQAVLQELGGPMTSTSANERGEPPADTARAVHDLLDRVDAAGSIAWLDGGDLAPSPPSTLVDCTADLPRSVRPGAVSLERLREVIHELAER
jgi:L-threonylcarbamoyladenylate synthase